MPSELYVFLSHLVPRAGCGILIVAFSSTLTLWALSLLNSMLLKSPRKCHIGHRIYRSRLITKPTKWPVRPGKTQINLGIRPVWSVPSPSLATHWAHSEDSDQTGRIWVWFRWFCREVAHLAEIERNCFACAFMFWTANKNKNEFL